MIYPSLSRYAAVFCGDSEARTGKALGGGVRPGAVPQADAAARAVPELRAVLVLGVAAEEAFGAGVVVVGNQEANALTLDPRAQMLGSVRNDLDALPVWCGQ